MMIVIGREDFQFGRFVDVSNSDIHSVASITVVTIDIAMETAKVSGEGLEREKEKGEKEERERERE